MEPHAHRHTHTHMQMREATCQCVCMFACVCIQKCARVCQRWCKGHVHTSFARSMLVSMLWMLCTLESAGCCRSNMLRFCRLSAFFSRCSAASKHLRSHPQHQCKARQNRGEHECEADKRRQLSKRQRPCPIENQPHRLLSLRLPCRQNTSPRRFHAAMLLGSSLILFVK